MPTASTNAMRTVAPAGRPDGQVHTALLGREIVHGPTERECLDHLTISQGLDELTWTRCRTTDPDSQLSERLVHREHRAEPAYDSRDRSSPYRVEQLSLHPPGQRL